MAPVAVKPTGYDVRDAARREARRDGLALGEWLDVVLGERASTLGLNPDALDATQRIDAILARLARATSLSDADGQGLKLHAGESGQSGIISAKRDATSGSERSLGRSEMPAAATKLHDDVDDLTDLPGTKEAFEQAAPTAAERRAAQRSDIESKLNSLFLALEKTPRRTEHAAMALAAEDVEAGGNDTKNDLLNHTAISPSWRFEKAVAEIAERQAFLEGQSQQHELAAGLHAAVRKREQPGVAAAGADHHATLDSRTLPHGTSIFTALQGDVARLSRRLDEMHVEGAPPAGLPMPASTGPNAAQEAQASVVVDRLEHQVDALSAKLDRMLDQQVPAEAVDNLSRRIEDMHGQLTARPGTPTVDVSQVEALVRDLVARADRSAAARPDLVSLETAVQDLAAKLDRAQADPATLADLQAQIGVLTTRIDKSDAGLPAIVALERSLGDIFAQLGAVRDVATEAAVVAARATAADMMQAGLPNDAAAASHDTAVTALRGEIVSIRAERDDADQRLHAILLALNGSLERVVDRLSALEEEASGSQSRATQGAAADDRAASWNRGRAGEERSQEPLDLDFPIKPGRTMAAEQTASSADGSPMAVDGPAKAPGSSTFIAAARRAAQTAAQDHVTRLDEETRTRAVPPAAERGPHRSASGLFGRRRPLLLALAGLVLLMGAAQIVRLGLRAEPVGDTDQTTEAAPVAALPDPVPASEAPAASTVPTAAVTASPQRDPAFGASTPAGLSDTLAKTDPVAGPANAAPTLPTMAMGPAANLAALKAADTSARLGANAGIAPGLLALATAGQAEAQYEVGLRYADGRGVGRDMKAAASWFEKAANKNLAPAAYRLGSLFEKGLGVARDPAQAVAWYGKAAGAGNVRAMHNLAVMMAEGATGKSDYAAAATWFTKAAQAGVRDSQYNLAILFARGLGVEPNLATSYMWFALAAQQGDLDSAKKRDDVAARLDGAVLERAKAAVEAFKPVPVSTPANDVTPPAGGWDAVHAPPSSLNGATAPAPVSHL